MWLKYLTPIHKCVDDYNKKYQAKSHEISARPGYDVFDPYVTYILRDAKKQQKSGLMSYENGVATYFPGNCSIVFFDQLKDESACTLVKMDPWLWLDWSSDMW